MLRYTTLGAKIILGISILLAGLAFYLPFLEAFALTPAIAFIHRFSITLNIGSDTKTLQPIVFVIPILLIKALWEYHKRHGLFSLLKSKLALIIGLMIIADLISLATSTSRGSSVAVFITHGMNMAIFITASLWLHLVSDLLSKEKLQKIGLTLIKTFAIALTAFTVTNAVVSVSQFADCSFTTQGCHVWKAIDEFFPNKLLLVGHQKFSKKPIIARAPGFFGDVNFNGMYSLFIVLGGTLLWILAEITKTEKGFLPTKEQRLLLIPIVAGLVSFLLTLSRSALLGAGVLGIAMGIIFLVPTIRKIGVKREITIQLIKIIAAFLTILTVFLIIGYQIELPYKNRTTTVSKQLVSYVTEMFNPTEDSAQGHSSLFLSAVKIGNQNPLFGMGMGTFGVQYEKLIEPGNGITANPHSTYGMLYAEQGIVGLAFYVGVIMFLWISAFKHGQRYVKELLVIRQQEKKLSREQYLYYGARFIVVFVAFGIPYFSVATISYYGFFLPMTWWWGNGELVKN